MYTIAPKNLPPPPPPDWSPELDLMNSSHSLFNSLTTCRSANWSISMTFSILISSSSLSLHMPQVVISLVPRRLPMEGNIWLHIQILWGHIYWNVGVPIRLASWLNHVTSHTFTMVTHLSQSTNVNAGDWESFEGTGLIFCGVVGG